MALNPCPTARWTEAIVIKHSGGISPSYFFDITVSRGDCKLRDVRRAGSPRAPIVVCLQLANGELS